MAKVNIKIAKSTRCNGDYSLYVTFDFDMRIVEVIRSFSTKFWNAEDKIWELPLNKLTELTTKIDWCEFDITADEYVTLEKPEVKVPDNFRFKTNPYDHQIVGFNYGLQNDRWLLGDEMGLGKALALNTKVYTPNGYKEIKDIQVGDYVFNRMGKPTKVLATYNHTNVEMYRITFSDGRTVECCKDHLWKIYDQQGSKVVDTKWFLSKDHFGINRYENLKLGKYYIDRCEPVQFEHKNVNLDGYVLGALLGDGCIVNGIGFTSKDNQIIAEINNRLPENYYLNSSSSMEDISYNIVQKTTNYTNGCIYYADGIKIGTLDETVNWLIKNNKVKTSKPESIYAYLYPKALDKVNVRYGYTWTYEKPLSRKGNLIKQWLVDLGLFGTNSHTKFIPDCYKYNDVQTRLDVIRGLMDTDGYATKDNLLQYTTVSKQLMEDVRWMIESLGGICSLTVSDCKCNDKITGIAYTLTIKIDNPQDLCLLDRKKCLLKPRKFKPRRSIIKIERIENADAKCITVEDNESLYLIDHFIVTHNTKQVIDIAVAKKLIKGYKHCLIVCGVNGLKWNWRNEVYTHSNESAYILGQKVKGSKISIGSNKDKLNDVKNLSNINSYFIITNVETLRDEAINEELQKLCKDGTIGMIAFDECHRAKNPTTQQGKGILKLQAETMIAMTGTPLMNNPMDLYIILKWLGYEKHAFYSFKKHYCVMGGFGGYEIVGYKNLDELQEQLDDIMLRRKKEEVLNLPEKTYIEEYVEMSAAQKKIYNEVTDEIKDNIDQISIAPNPLAELIRMRQATGYTGILSSTVKESAKLDRMEELVEEAKENGKKVVIFSNWTQMTDVIYTRLTTKGFRIAQITGETPDAQRQSIVENFQTGRYDAIIGTSGAMGTGLTLTAGTVEIFLDEPWNMALKEQCVDRCHRIGQKDNLTIYTLMCKDTIDERIHEIVEQKGEMANAIVDGKVTMNNKELLNYLLS